MRMVIKFFNKSEPVDDHARAKAVYITAHETTNFKA